MSYTCRPRHRRSLTRTPDTLLPSPRSAPSPDGRLPAPPSPGTRRSPGTPPPGAGAHRHRPPGRRPAPMHRKPGSWRPANPHRPRASPKLWQTTPHVSTPTPSGRIAHARPRSCGRGPGRRLQQRQAGSRQRAEYPVRELRQVRLELRRVRAVHDRLPEHRLLFRRGRGWRLWGRRRLCRHRGPRLAGVPQRLHRRTVQVPRRSCPAGRLPVANCSPRSRTEQTVGAAQVETRRLQRSLDPSPRGAIEIQPLLEHGAVAAPHTSHAAGAATAGTALPQRRLPGTGRRVERFRPAHRRTVGVRDFPRSVPARPRQHSVAPRKVSSASSEAGLNRFTFTFPRYDQRRVMTSVRHASAVAPGVALRDPLIL